jgi:hypothetical protein
MPTTKLVAVWFDLEIRSDFRYFRIKPIELVAASFGEQIWLSAW